MLKKETKRKILSVLVPPLGAFLLRLIYFTCKVRFIGSDFPKTHAIYITWHGELIMSPFCYKKKQEKTRNFCVIVSPHFDGQLIGKTIQWIIGGKNIEGSSSKGGASALRLAFKTLKDRKNDIAIAPDGPRGPRHEVAQGVVVLSQRLNVPIVAVNCQASSCWRFNSWDKMFLPKPFSRIDFFVSEPFFLDGLELHEAKQKVKERLMENASI